MWNSYYQYKENQVIGGVRLEASSRGGTQGAGVREVAASAG